MMPIEQLLSDPFHRSLYVPLRNLKENTQQNIANVFKDIESLSLTDNDGQLQEPLKSHMKIIYGIDSGHEPMRTRKREPYNQNEEMMRTRKRGPYDQNEEMMRTRKRGPYDQNEEMMRTRKREPCNQNEVMMRTRKREPHSHNEEMMRTRKRGPYDQNEEMMRTRKREPFNQNEEMMRTRKRNPSDQNEFINFIENKPMGSLNRAINNLESCNSNQFSKYVINSGNGTISKRSDFFVASDDDRHYNRHKRELPFNPDDIQSEELVTRHDEHQDGGGLAPIKRFDFNDSIVEHFFEYDSETLSHIVMEILEQRCQENYDNAFLEVFKVVNKDSYDDKPLHEKVFLFRKFLRLYKEYNDEMLRGVMFDLPKRLKNHAIEHFLRNNPKGRDFLSYWETEEEIDVRFRNLYQQFQHALIERNYEMEQQLYELACPKGYTEMLLDDFTTNSAEALSAEREEKRLREHAKRYLRRKLNSAAMLSTTTASQHLELDAFRA